MSDGLLKFIYSENRIYPEYNDYINYNDEEINNILINELPIEYRNDSIFEYKIIIDRLNQEYIIEVWGRID